MCMRVQRCVSVLRLFGRKADEPLLAACKALRSAYTHTYPGGCLKCPQVFWPHVMLWPRTSISHRGIDTTPLPDSAVDTKAATQKAARARGLRQQGCARTASSCSAQVGLEVSQEARRRQEVDGVKRCYYSHSRQFKKQHTHVVESHDVESQKPSGQTKNARVPRHQQRPRYLHGMCMF